MTEMHRWFWCFVIHFSPLVSKKFLALTSVALIPFILFLPSATPLMQVLIISFVLTFISCKTDLLISSLISIKNISDKYLCFSAIFSILLLLVLSCPCVKCEKRHLSFLCGNLLEQGLKAPRPLPFCYCWWQSCVKALPTKVLEWR